MNIYFKSLGVLMGFMLTLNLSAFAQRGMGDSNGVARLGEEPTIVTFEGILNQIKTGPCEHTTGNSIIGTHLFIDIEGSDQLVNVHLGAAYAVEPFLVELETGNMIEIEAFQTKEMEALEYVAIKLTSNGYSFELRDENLRPIWAGGQNLGEGKPFGRRGYRW
ncbi:MAG: hypothetical protein GVY07_01385 [Bacteroidetes bacterium]|jgi:hypothetical protein|nr:hypothetical protein [Bacteroidota bacterium]